MSILDTIETIQKKPEQTRRRILFVSVGVVMATIIGLWIWTLPYTLESVTSKSTETKTANDASPFTIIKDLAHEGYETFSKQFLNH